MCSLWVTMEHDEGDLQAVVRAGRGLACSSLSGRNPSVHNGNEVVHNQAYNSWEGVEPGSTCLAGVQGAAAAPDDGGSFPQMGFPNLLRASPSPGMDLQGLCAIPFYSGGILMRSAPANVDAPAFAPAPEEPLQVEKKLCHAEQEFGGSPAASAFAPAADSGLADVPGSKPPKVEGGDANANSPPAHPRPADGGMNAAPGPSPKNPGSKRRKTQQKRIVCVPAAGGSNRPSGEGLPSDLWAWRKYGQKPIKGSPYPRGYYRCSSSKGCSARKQVERSRTDPTMLVITYTSDHNHPWPTHRNALAGSTRQTNSAEKIASAVSQSQETTTATTTTTANNNTAESSEAMAAENLLNSSKIDSPASGADHFNVREDDEVQAGGYPRHDDDFFADLGELPESLNILALRHFDEDKSDEEAAAGSMPMSSGTVADPFNLFNWSSSTFVDT